jgi:uncharacterized membrane protein
MQRSEHPVGPSLAVSPAAAPGHRLHAIDWMRGLVMVVMALDHSSAEFNAGRLFTDGTFTYQPGTPLPAAQFLTRWVTHLCAPTFVFLAGTSLALQIDRRVAKGDTPWAIDRYLVTRGLVIAGFELWVSLFWMPPGRLLLQVLYAIGTSYVAMTGLRRLPTAGLAAVALAVVTLGEAVTGAFGWGPPATTPLAAALLLVPGRRGSLIVAYPTLHWLAILLLGWVLGRLLVRRPDPRVVSRGLALSGLGLLGVFAVVRGANAYGNMGLYREGSSLVQWLHVSKYPPSLSFDALELGLMALALAGLTLAETRVVASERGLLTVLGRTPMFFYLLHIPVLVLTAHGLGVASRLGLGATFGFAVAVVVALYPLCLVYGRYRAAHPRGWTRYV